MKTKKVRLVVEFANVEDATEWLVAIKSNGHLPPEARAWPMDALDKRGGGIREYIIRRGTMERLGEPLRA